jgi:hypothetical protein
MDVCCHTIEANMKILPVVSSVVFIALFEDHFEPNLHSDSFRTAQWTHSISIIYTNKLQGNDFILFWDQYKKVSQYTYNVNIESRSFNHCRSGKIISITQSVCVFVALGIQHAMRMGRYFNLWLALSTIFFYIIP